MTTTRAAQRAWLKKILNVDITDSAPLVGAAGAGKPADGHGGSVIGLLNDPIGTAGRAASAAVGAAIDVAQRLNDAAPMALQAMEALDKSIDLKIEWIKNEADRIEKLPGGDTDPDDDGALMKLANTIGLSAVHAYDWVVDGREKADAEEKYSKQLQEDCRAQFAPLGKAVRRLRADYKQVTTARRVAVKLSDLAARYKINLAIEARIARLRDEVKLLVASADQAADTIFARKSAEAAAENLADKRRAADQEQRTAAFDGAAGANHQEGAVTLEASIDKEIEWIAKEIERIQVMPGGDSDIYEPGAFMKLATKMVVRLEHVTDVLTEGESKAAEDARDRKQREEDGRAQFGPLSIAVTKLKAEYKASSAQRHEAAKMTDSAARDQIYRAIDARITALRTEVKRLLADAEAAGAAIFERQRAETRAQIAKDQQTTAAQNALLEAGRTGRR